MAYTNTGYHLYHVDYLTPRTAAEWQQLNNSFQSVVQSASQDKILAAFPKLETRWDSTVCCVNDWGPPPPEPPPHPATDPPYVPPPWGIAPSHPPSSWDPAFQTTDLSGQQWYPNVGYTERQYGHQPPHGHDQYSLPPFESPPTPEPAPPYFGSALSTPYQETSEYQYSPPLVQDQYAHDAHIAPHSGWYQQPHHSSPNIVKQTLDPCYRLEVYQQRADDQLLLQPAQPPCMGFNLPEPPPPRYTPDLEPNLSMAALLSQLERLTADVEQLVSRMDAKERRLGDPQATTLPPPATSFSVPYTAPVSCHLPQPIATATKEKENDFTNGREEEVWHVANEIQLDPEFPDVIAQKKEAIRSSNEDSFTLGNVEASKELIVKLGYSGIGRNELDNKWILEEGLDVSVDVLEFLI